MSTDEHAIMAALDAYVDALRTMPNPVGDAVRAIDHAEATGLPPLEMFLAGDLAQSVASGESEIEWVRRHIHLAHQPPLEGVPYADAPHRLSQAAANLEHAGLWPYA